MSLAAGNCRSNSRIARSESSQASTIASPRNSTDETPGSARSCAAFTSGRVARMVRSPTSALISVVGPSATIRPCAISTIRSA